MCVTDEARSKLAKLLFKSMFVKDTTHLFVLFTVCVVYASILLNVHNCKQVFSGECFVYVSGC